MYDSPQTVHEKDPNNKKKKHTKYDFFVKFLFMCSVCFMESVMF